MSDKRVEFYRHSVGEEERKAVDTTLSELFLTTGKRVSAFEEELARYLGGNVGVVAVSSCTAALHLALLSLGVGPGDEVILPPMTFIASANAVLFTGATPVFSDVESTAGTLDPRLVEDRITSRTRAILCVHLYGQMADVVALRKICDRHGLALIEDAAHALESVRDGVRPGHLGDAACFSFYATKNITSGEGGAIAMRNRDRLAHARRLSLHGMSAGAEARYQGAYRHWDMLELGFKYNLTNIAAAMLSPQLRRVDALRTRRELLARRYEQAFAGQLEFPRVREGSVSARHLFTLWAPGSRRDEFLAKLGARGIGVAVNYRAIHLLSYYMERFGHRRATFPVAEEIGDRTLSIPLYPNLSDEEQDQVIAKVTDVLRDT